MRWCNLMFNRSAITSATAHPVRFFLNASICSEGIVKSGKIAKMVSVSTASRANCSAILLSPYFP